VACSAATASANARPGQKSVHICVQSKAAATSSDSHEVQQSGRKHAIVRKDANCGGPRQTVIVGDEGLEPPTPSV
jgi:hypothetical protein